MSFSFSQYIEDSLNQPSSSAQRLVDQIKQSGRHHTPKEADIRAAVNCGHANVVQAILDAPSLNEQSRMNLATQGLQVWAVNPLASRQAPEIVDSLMRAGADPSAPDSQGQSPASRIGKMRDRVLLEESKPPKTGNRATVGPTRAGSVLEACAAKMSVELPEPSPVRLWMQARRASPIPGVTVGKKPAP